MSSRIGTRSVQVIKAFGGRIHQEYKDTMSRTKYYNDGNVEDWMFLTLEEEEEDQD